MRVHAVSDLHADYAQNLQWYIPLPRHPSTHHKQAHALHSTP